MKTYSESAFSDSLSERQQSWKNILKEILNFDESHPSLLELGQASSLLEFKFGDQIASFPPNFPGTNQPYPQDLYLICQGKVRLISWNNSKKRELSIKLLNQNESFGGDSQWSKIICSYQAIATSPVKILKISLTELNPWLEKRPELDNYWRHETQHRQALIFFKSFTELSTLSSRRLQQLLPYLKEREIAAGEKLSSLVAKESARFWLRSGQIAGGSIENGSSWGYMAQTPKEWVAQTPLYVYEILKQDWDAVRTMVPILDNSNSSPKSSTNKLPSTNPANAQPPTVNPPVASVQDSPPQLASDLAKEQTPTIDFPKPLKRRKRLWQNYPFIEQQSAADCGATCLAMISQYWGKRFSINFLRNLTEVGRSGASLKKLAAAAESLGYQARPVRASLNRLLEQSNPWIAHWQGDHYVVVYRTQGDQLLVADPAEGKRLIPRQEFVKGWTGYALILDPTENLNRIPSDKPSLGRFLKLLLPYRNLGTQVILASFLIQIFGVISPLFTQIILDKVVVSKNITTLHVFAIGILIFGLSSIFLSAIRQYLISYLANRLDLTMIGGFIRHTLLLPLKFFENRHVGDIITRVNENQKIQRFLLNQVVLAWLDFLMGFVYLGLMFYYNWRLSVLIIALIPPIMLVTLVATPLLRKVSREVFNRSAEQNSSLVETINGISTIKATATERELRWRWEDRMINYLNARFKGQKLGINLQAASGLINSLGSTALLWYGATLVIQDQLTIGQFVAFNMMIGKVLSPVLSLSNLWDELQEVLISVERLDDIFSTDPEEKPNQQMLQLPTLKGQIKFDNVTFSYDSDQEHHTLQNISFEVKPGETVAIVGRSGSGKTTLVKLLQGLYYPNSGSIWIDNHDIHHISPQSLRSQMGVVPQECFLFSGTVLENITLYRPGFSLKQAMEVAQLAEAHAFIQAMPLSYNTKVGERGSNLSGGQRQRISIARALLGEPPILILDEATSSLDTESERRFQQNLTRLSRNRTTFIIAHRLSTVRNADCILVLDRGILAEKGTHAQLMELQGIYYHLAQQQLDL